MDSGHQKRVFSPMPGVKTPKNTRRVDKFPIVAERAKKSILKYKSIHRLAQACISGHYQPENSPDSFCRPLLWKSILLRLEIVNSETEGYILDLRNLEKSRNKYSQLVNSIAPPWHLLPKDSPYYRPSSMNNKDATMDLMDNSKHNSNFYIQKPQTEKVNDDSHPLSGSPSRPKKKVDDIEILNIIIMDVERLFPEYPKMFIESLKDKQHVIEIIYRYSKTCTRGYIQGFHEICGVILLNELTQDNHDENDSFVVSDEDEDDEEDDMTESKEGNPAQEEDLINVANNNSSNKRNTPTMHTETTLDKQINNLLNEKYFMHDVYSVFEAFITPLLEKYFTSSGVVQESILFGIKLRHIDPVLEEALRRVEVVGGHAQVWLSRWFRMLGTREIGVRKGIRLWDGLISFSGVITTNKNDPIDVSNMLPFTILVMLMNIRTELLIASGANPTIAALNDKSDQRKSVLYQSDDDIDDTDVLFLLLHYPDSAINTVTELIEDSASLALVQTDDGELKKRGAAIVDKCNSRRGILGGVISKPKTEAPVVKNATKSSASSSSWTGIFKKAGNLSWSNTTPNKNAPKTSVPSKDQDRLRLEMKLQQRVRDRLNN